MVSKCARNTGLVNPYPNFKVDAQAACVYPPVAINNMIDCVFSFKDAPGKFPQDSLESIRTLTMLIPYQAIQFRKIVNQGLPGKPRFQW